MRFQFKKTAQRSSGFKLPRAEAVFETLRPSGNASLNDRAQKRVILRVVDSGSVSFYTETRL